MNITTLTVVPADKTIAVDGEAWVCDFAAPAYVHAIQWHADHGGQVEMQLGPPRPILRPGDGTLPPELAAYLPAWRAGRVRGLAAQLELKRNHLASVTQAKETTARAAEGHAAHLAALDAQLADTAEDNPNRGSAQNARDRAANQAAQTGAALDRLAAQEATLTAEAAELAGRLDAAKAVA